MLFVSFAPRRRARTSPRAPAGMETAPPPPAASKLTLNDVVGYPRPGYDVPELYAFSPDDGLVTSLCAPERGTSSRNLYAFDTATGETASHTTPFAL